MHFIGIPSSANLFQQCITPNPSLKNQKVCGTHNSHFKIEIESRKTI